MITLSSDFGSPYPAAMKGVIRQQSTADLVDVSHDFPRQDVRTTAFWLREVLPYFPPAVHLVVVDPGVGTDRAAIAIRVGDHALVGPDNGVLLPAARELAGAGDVESFRVEYDDPESVTFHGRDVFAPAAATVYEAGIASFDDEPGFADIADVVDLTLPEPSVDDDGATGEVLVVDDFGTAITNVPGDVLAGRYGEEVTVNDSTAPVHRTYAAVDPGQRLVTVGSHGNVELAVNQGRGYEAFAVTAREEVRLQF
jgi:S-adenosylmethionine hydrolase